MRLGGPDQAMPDWCTHVSLATLGVCRLTTADNEGMSDELTYRISRTVRFFVSHDAVVMSCSADPAINASRQPQSHR